jgi:predicted nuclease of predicted toxin-antitoxin system
MKFLIDAQLPKALSQILKDAGQDSLHTLDLPNKNNTTDTQINELSLKEKRIEFQKITILCSR